MVQDIAAEYWHLADTTWLERHRPLLPALREALAQAEARAPAEAGDLLADTCFLFLQLGLAAEARQAWLRLESTGALAPSRVLAQGTAGAGMAAVEPAARFALAGSRLHWGLEPEQVLALADRALALVDHAQASLAPTACHPGDAAGAVAEAALVPGEAATSAPKPVDALARLRYQAQRMRLGSGRLDEVAAQAALADMAALEQPTWPHRLRAQRLLAGLDHLAQWRPAAPDEAPREGAGPTAGVEARVEAGVEAAPAEVVAAGGLRADDHVAPGPGPLPHPGPTATLAALQQQRTALRKLADAAGLDTLASLARIGLAESHLWAGRWVDARGAARSLLAPGATPLPGNQLLLALGVQLAAELALAHQAVAAPARGAARRPSAGEGASAGHPWAANATGTLRQLLAASASRRWEWVEAQASLAAWWGALHAAQALRASQVWPGGLGGEPGAAPATAPRAMAGAPTGASAPGADGRASLATAHALAGLAARLQPAGPPSRWLHWLAAAGEAARQGLPPATGDEPWLEDGPAMLAYLGWDAVVGDAAALDGSSPTSPTP